LEDDATERPINPNAEAEAATKAAADAEAAHQLRHQQHLEAQAHILIHDASVALHAAQAAVPPLAPEVIAALQANLSNAQSLLMTIRSGTLLGAATAITQLQGDIADGHADLSMAMIENHWDRDGMGHLHFSPVTIARIHTRSHRLDTDEDLTNYARTFVDEKAPPEYTEHIKDWMKNSPEGQQTVAIHNATSEETRIKVEIDQEKSKIYAKQLAHSKHCPAELRKLLEEHKERDTTAPELIPDYLALINHRGNTKAAEQHIRRHLRECASHQDHYMHDHIPALEKELHLRPGIVSGTDMGHDMWKEVADIRHDKHRHDRANDACWWMGTLSKTNPSWEDLEKQLKAAGFNEKEIRDAALLRVTTLANAKYTMQVVTGLHIAYELGHGSPEFKAEMEKIHDQNLPAAERAKLLVPWVRDSAQRWRYKDLSDEALAAALANGLKFTDERGGLEGLHQASQKGTLGALAVDYTRGWGERLPHSEMPTDNTPPRDTQQAGAALLNNGVTQAAPTADNSALLAGFLAQQAAASKDAPAAPARV